MAKMLPKVGAVKCQACGNVTPLRRMGNGLVRYDCQCGLSVQAHDDDASHGLEKLAGGAVQTPAPIPAPAPAPLQKAPPAKQTPPPPAQPEKKAGSWADNLFS